MAKVATMLKRNQAAEKPGYNRPAPIAQMPGCPGGTPKLAIWLVEVPGATLDSHWLHAASVLFFKCGLPPYSRVVPVDASSHALAT